MKYLEAGQGQPLILVHGGFTDARMWHKAQAILAEKYHVYSITQRYFCGNEGPAPESFGYETHANDLNYFARQHCRAKPHVVAWSYGADVALLAAALDPGAFESLFLYEPGRHTHLSSESLDAYFADAETMFGSLHAPLQSGDPLLGIKAMLDASATTQGYFDTQPDFIQEIYRDNAFTLPRQLKQAPSREVTCDDLSRLKLPVCYARGEHTRPLFSIATDEASGCTPASGHVVVPGANHMLPIDEPEAFCRLVEAFLSNSKAP